MQHHLIFTAALAAGLGAASVVMPHAALGEDQVLARGELRGESGHTASGGVRVVKTADGVQVVLDPNFRFDGAPDPKLGFGRDGYIKSTQFSHLRSNGGAQTYPLPASLDPAKYNEVWIWCQRYSVPLGVATLE